MAVIRADLPVIFRLLPTSNHLRRESSRKTPRPRGRGVSCFNKFAEAFQRATRKNIRLAAVLVYELVAATLIHGPGKTEADCKVPGPVQLKISPF